jgi:hypothetical protein
MVAGLGDRYILDLEAGDGSVVILVGLNDMSGVSGVRWVKAYG